MIAECDLIKEAKENMDETESNVYEAVSDMISRLR